MSTAVTEWPGFVHKHDGKLVPGVPLPAPCPFCGRIDSAIDRQSASFHVECGYCGAEGPYGTAPLEAAQYRNAPGELPPCDWGES